VFRGSYQGNPGLNAATRAFNLAAPKGSTVAEPTGHKAESDVEPEAHETRSRASAGEDDGTYVGRTNPDDDFDAGETGAEARSQQD